MEGFFVCKQKTSYEMRISDWSSDVCSSDLVQAGLVIAHVPFERRYAGLLGKGLRLGVVAGIVCGDREPHVLERQADCLANSTCSARDDCNLDRKSVV